MRGGLTLLLVAGVSGLHLPSLRARVAPSVARTCPLVLMASPLPTEEAAPGGFRFCPLPEDKASPLEEFAEFEELAHRLSTFYSSEKATAPQEFKAELLKAAEAVSRRAGGVDQVAAGMSEAQLQRAFVVMSFLVHFYVWCEDGNTEQVVPRSVAVPYWRVAKALGFEPVYTDAVIMWNMIPAPGAAPEAATSCNPDDIHLEFSWTGTQSERWFAVIQGAILRLLDPLMGRAQHMKDEVLPRLLQSGGGDGDGALSDEEAAALHETVVAFCTDLDATLVQARLVMGRMFERLDPNDFLVFRRFFEGWQSVRKRQRRFRTPPPHD
eukprot:2325648-Prymnesium_polylepis.1